MIRFYLLLLNLLFLFPYNQSSPLIKLELPLSMQQKILHHNTSDRFLVYYHSGECSFCYATISVISNEFPDVKLISVSSSQNQILVDFYLEQIQFKGLSLIDSASLFLNGNQKLLSTQNLFLIDKQFNVLTGGWDFNQSIKGKITLALRDY